MTAEEQYGVIKEPKYCCPLIEEAINDKDLALLEMRKPDVMNEDELRSACENATWRLESIDFESIRELVDEIRMWGNHWKDTALNALSELDQ